MGRWFKRLSIALLLALVALPLSSVLAISDPDSISINSVKAYEGLWEEGDMLFIVEYEVMYGVDPDEDPEDTFLVGLWDGTVKGPDRALAYYQHNFTSIYLTAAQVTSFGYELNDELKVRVTGNPSAFPVLTEGVNMKTTTLTSGHWNKGVDMDETREFLSTWCIIIAETLEDSWEIPLLTTGGRLNTTGMVKFKEAIPGLDSICPDIFQVATSYPDYEDPEYDPTYEEDLLDRAGTKLTTALEGLGLWITGKSDTGLLIGGVGLAILFFVLAGRIFIATGSVPTSIAVSLPFLFAGNLIGILPLTITFVAAFLVAVLFGITFVLGRL